MPFSAPLDLQKLLDLMATFNIVLPWNRAKSGESFYTENIYLEDLDLSPTFSKWEFLDYGPQLRLCLNQYKEEIRARQASFRRPQ